MSVDSSEMTIESFPEKISPSEAEATIKDTDDEIETAYVRRSVYYPYGIFTFQVQAQLLLHTNVDTVYCGVDLIRENELLIDSNASYETKTITADRVLPKECEQDVALKTARTYVRDLVLQQLKPLRTPTIKSVSRQLVHRLFYIVVVETADENTLQYAVDSVLGNYHRIYLPPEDNDVR